ncbi:MAG TPA: DUF3048 domain-containing protein [Candidatus Dormibacteraeota bacterium]|nr:DUF3048 domain-containing protein [Candidatus Dormibacteraeota bacterium]
MAIALVVVLILGGGGAAFVLTRPPPVRARLTVRPGTRVDIHQTVVVRFDRGVDLSRVRVGLDPSAHVHLDRSRSELRVAPVSTWQVDTRYRLRIAGVTSQGAAPLQEWTARFRTQLAFPATFEADGHALGAQASVSPFVPLTIVFGAPVRPGSVRVTWAGQPLPARNLGWQAGDRGAAITIPTPQLGTAVPLALVSATSQRGQQVTKAASVQLTQLVVEPAAQAESNGAAPASPSMVVVANDGGARPQAGLQQADIVFEYISEYGVSRMTAIYFGTAPGEVGPVRSCRPINLYIGFGFDGHTLCSGASAGTLHYIWTAGHVLPGVMWDWEPRGRHFFVDPDRASPDDVFTSGQKAAPLRSQQPLPAPTYAVDSAHAAQPPQGIPAGSVSVPAQNVTWSYDAATHAYLRSNYGAPSVDANSGAQLRATNVVVMDVPSHLTSWIEDDNGGAHAVWYTMLGSGPAQVYMDSQMIQATWHMGQAAAQEYYTNRDPVWFTDSRGQVIRLDTGLTWIHVVGSGQ